MINHFVAPCVKTCGLMTACLVALVIGFIIVIASPCSSQMTITSHQLDLLQCMTRADFVLNESERLFTSGRLTNHTTQSNVT